MGTMQVLVLRKTGAGKSSLGNTLLGGDAFHVARRQRSDTKLCQWSYGDIMGSGVRLEMIRDEANDTCQCHAGTTNSVKTNRLEENISAEKDDVDKSPPSVEQAGFATNRGKTSRATKSHVNLPENLHRSSSSKEQAAFATGRDKTNRSPPKLLHFLGGVLMLFIVVSPLTGAICIGREVDLADGEAMLVCRVAVDIQQTKHKIAVVYTAPENSTPDHPLTCVWDADSLSCMGRLDSTGIDVLSDRVIIKARKSSLKSSGSYQCQLVPPDVSNSLDDCQIKEQNKSEVSTAAAQTPSGRPLTAFVTKTSEALADEGHSSALGAPKESDLTYGSGGHPEGLVVAVVVLSCTMVIQLLLFVAFIIIFRKQNMLTCKMPYDNRDESPPLNCKKSNSDFE